MQTLEKCKLQQQVRIKMILPCEMKRRLLDLGFVHGASVTPILDSPSKGIRAYLINGCKIALRASVARQIEVEKGDGGLV